MSTPLLRYEPNPSPLGRFHPGCSRSRLISIYIRRAPDHDVFTRDCNCAAHVHGSFVRADVVSLNRGLRYSIASWNERWHCYCVWTIQIGNLVGSIFIIFRNQILKFILYLVISVPMLNDINVSEGLKIWFALIDFFFFFFCQDVQLWN